MPPERLEQAQDEATLEAIRDQERAGVDIITDGEIRRESYSNKFANALDGIDGKRIGEIVGRTGNKIPVPIVSGPIKRRGPVEVRDVEFLRANTDKTIKITLPGPFTMAQQAVDEHYRDDESLALAYAEAVNEEVHDLFAAGADVVQLDEPWLQARAEAARRYGIKAINRALAGVRGTTALHLCFGYAALVKDKPASGYSFLAELEESAANQISIEAAQPKLDLGVLRALRVEDRARRRARLERPQRRERASSRDADSRGARGRAGRAAHRDARLRHEVPAARRRVRQARRRSSPAPSSCARSSRARWEQKEKAGAFVPAFPCSDGLLLGIRKDPSPSPLQNSEEVVLERDPVLARPAAIVGDRLPRRCAQARRRPAGRPASRTRGRTTARCSHRPRRSGC